MAAMFAAIAASSSVVAAPAGMATASISNNRNNARSAICFDPPGAPHYGGGVSKQSTTGRSLGGKLEVRAGIEPASADLQSDASPLCHRTPGRREAYMVRATGWGQEATRA